MTRPFLGFEYESDSAKFLRDEKARHTKPQVKPEYLTLPEKMKSTPKYTIGTVVRTERKPLEYSPNDSAHNGSLPPGSSSYQLMRIAKIENGMVHFDIFGDLHRKVGFEPIEPVKNFERRLRTMEYTIATNEDV